MIKRLLLVLLAVATFWVYRTAFIYAIGYATAMPFPGWWLRVVPRSAHGIFVWTFLWHTAAVIMVALPVAWLLARFYGHLGLYLGAIATLALIAPDIMSMTRVHGLMSAFDVAITTVDFIKIVIALPLLVWIFLRLPSNVVGAARDGGTVGAP